MPVLGVGAATKRGREAQGRVIKRIESAGVVLVGQWLAAEPASVQPGGRVCFCWPVLLLGAAWLLPVVLQRNIAIGLPLARGPSANGSA